MKAVRHLLIPTAGLGTRMRVVDADREGADEHRELRERCSGGF